MIEAGRLVMKLAGRDAGRLGVIVEVIDNTYVIIDGEVRRKKCNIKHLEILNKKLDIKSKASNAEVVKAMNHAGIKVEEKKEKTDKPAPVKKAPAEKPVAEKKPAKKAVKKAAKK
jgi:large subunit ribosomal protein L14e